MANYRGSNPLQLSITLDGLQRAQAGLSRLPQEMRTNFAQALKTWADDVLSKSQALVPVATGALRNSGKVFGPVTQGPATEVVVGYGSRHHAWYAAIVHERMDVRHPRGQAKYLEQPLTEGMKTLDDALTAALDAALRVSMAHAA